MRTSLMTRRDFVRLGAGAAVAGAAMQSTLLEPAPLAAQTLPGGRKIRFAIVGTGIRGCDLLRSARKVPTGVCVGAADLYATRHQAAKEAYGADIPTTGDYRTLLDRKDVDAVLVATSDHHHRRVTLDAVAAGKDVYCEKPMSHSVADGFADGGGGAGEQAHLSGRQPAGELDSLREGAGDLSLGTAGRGARDRCAVEPQLAGRRVGVSDSARRQPGDDRLEGVSGGCAGSAVRPGAVLPLAAASCDYGSGLGGDLFVHLLSRHPGDYRA